MLQGKIEAPDVRLARLLAARMLEDEGIGIDADAIGAFAINDGVATPQLRFAWPLRELRVPISSYGIDAHDWTADGIVKVAREQVDAYRRIMQDCGDLEALIAEARTVAKREVAKLRRRGVEVELIEVRPSTIETLGDWLPSPEVVVEILDEALQPERLGIVVEDAAEIAEELSDERFRGRQTLRSARKAWLDEAGASCALDAVIAATLQAGGIDVADVVRRMFADKRGLQFDANGRLITVTWRDGLISGAFVLDETARYVRDSIIYDGVPSKGTIRRLKGLTADVVVPDALLEDAVITSAKESFGKLTLEIGPRYLLVDAATELLTDRILPM